MIYWQLILVYLKIGMFGFGGGYAMLSLIQYEVVDDKICNFITYWFTVTYNVYQRAVLNLVSFWYHYITFVIISLNFISYIFLLYF